MASSEVLSVERDGHVATLWLDRAEKRNALGPSFWSDLPLVMAELDDETAVRAVVVAARGPHFSVGLDLKSLPMEVGPGGSSQAARSWQAYRAIKRLQRAISSVASCTKPVIAAVHGYCIGGGVDLISACDIRLAAADAVFSVRETRIAIVADLGTLQRLPKIIAAGHAAELAYTGKDIGSERALRIGLVNEVLDDAATLHDAARSMAAEIASNSPNAVQGTKAVLRASAGRSVEEGLDYVAAWNAGFLPSHDLTEAMAAFAEKRSPSFTGE